MSDNILVVEYEPRYTDRVKQALSGQPYDPVFVKDGEEALSTLDKRQPRLIVMSSVLPKISAPELIRMIRERSDFKATPILVTVSGYNGKSTRADAMKLGASDILPKPYSEGEFLGKVKQLLGGASQQTVALDLRELGLVNPKSPAIPPSSGPKLTSDDIFGDMVDDKNPAAAASRKTAKAAQDLDDMLSQTLSGVRAVKRPAGQPVPTAPTASAPSASGAAASKPAAKPRSSIDDLVQNTLSGLEKQGRPRPGEASSSATLMQQTPTPVIEAPPAPATPAPPVVARTAPAPEPMAPKMTVSAPIITPRVEPDRHDDKEDVDGVRFGQYVLKEKIATGGMAEVWKARMRGVEGFQKMVAIKKILPHMSDNEEFVTMFIDEAKLAAQLNHNNIIHIYDLGKIASSFYIAMEFIDGRDLKAILKRGEDRGQPMTIELALFIASKIASALDYAHRKRDFDEKEMGLVHRDVSPQNVLISYEGDIKLCDFGIAKAASKASHTIAGALKGKLQYMSPEQARGKNIDRRSDIFALAVVLFEMLTGRKLFTGESEMSILEQVREGQVQTPSALNDEVTPEIDHIVLKALEKNADDRYQTAGEMARDLDAVLYSFRPTPTSADLAIFMHRIYSEDDQVAAEPVEEVTAPTVVVPVPVIKPAAAAPAPVSPSPAPAAAAYSAPVTTVQAAPEPTFSFGAEPEKKKAPVVAIAIAAVVALAVIGGIFMATRKGSPAPAVNPPVQTAASSTSLNSTAPVATATTAPLVSATTGSTATTGTALGQGDQALINDEVKKRLAQEKAKLDQQKAAQQAALQQPTPAGAKPPTVTTPVPVPVASVPAPVTQTVAAQPVSPPPAPTQTVAESRPEPAVSRVKEGDLVEQGTEGLEPPQPVKQNRPQYPPMAKVQRVEGLVVIRALVSETGRVIDVNVLRGVKQNVGINEAAIQAVRGWTFRPATKDGVRVKAYYTTTLPFKL